MTFTKSRYLSKVKPGELFVHKVMRTLVVCERTPRGYRHLLSVNGDTNDVSVFTKPKVLAVERPRDDHTLLVRKSRLVELLKRVFAARKEPVAPCLEYINGLASS